MNRPAAIATWSFGVRAVAETGRVLTEEADAVRAVEAGINTAEMDPEIDSVGYGGLPNADGQMEMDAALMEGRHFGVGSVAGLKGCRRPISAARLVLQECHHSMLVGDGAAEFVAAHGMPPEDALTAKSRTAHQEWVAAGRPPRDPGHDTIGLCTIDSGGHLVAGCSTSGLRFKHPGRVGDTPIVGSGLYADDRAGAAAATGDGDHIQKYCMSFLVVELMRAGASPMDACREVLHRYLESHTDPPTREISLIALSPEGEFGAGTLMKSFPYGVWTPSGAEERAEAPCDQP